MTLSDRDKKILIVLVPVLAIVGYWFLLLAPKREEASTASTELAEQVERRDSAQAQLGAAKGDKTDFAADYGQIVRLGKAIPASVDMPSLIVQLDSAAAGTGIVFTAIKTGERLETPAAAPSAPPADAPPAAAGGAPAQSAPGGAVESANDTAQTSNQQAAAADQSGASAAAPGATGATPTAPAGLETVPLELEFTGNFFNLADFFHRVKRFVRVANDNVVVGGRLLTVEGVRWSTDAELFPKVRAELKATIYLSPKAEGVNAGATPTGPSQTTPATAAPTTPAPSSPAAPTATATP